MRNEHTVIVSLSIHKHEATPYCIEAWDLDEVHDDLIATGVTDEDGRCELTLDPARYQESCDRYPDVFFRIFDGDRLLCDTRDSVLCNLRPGTHKVVIQVPEPELPRKAKKPPPPKVNPIVGQVLLSPGFEHELMVEAFADAELKRSLGSTLTDADGRFEIQPTESFAAVWFHWSRKAATGRSPKLQPFSPERPVRLHVYGPWRGAPRGSERFQASVLSTSNRPVTGIRVALLEVALRRCQVIGGAHSDSNGTAAIIYDPASLFNDRPDLRVVVFDVDGTPLLESKSAEVVLPGGLARTTTTFANVTDALREEGLGGQGDLRLTVEEFRLLSERSGISTESLVSFAAASALAPELGVPTEAVFGLLASDAPGLEAALEQTIEQDLISTELIRRTDLLPKIDTALKRKAARDNLGRGSLDDFLATQVKESADRDEIAGLILENQRLPNLLRALEERQLATPEVRFLLDLQSIVGVDVGLAEKLGRSFADGKRRDGEDLALDRIADWERYDSESDELGSELRRSRARARMTRAQKLFPEKIFRQQIERHRDAPWANRIQSYLEKHPDHTFISPLPLPDDSMATADAAELAAYTAYKRILNWTDDHNAVGEFFRSNITFAQDVAAIGQDEFVARFADIFDGDKSAAIEAHQRAVKTTTALNCAISFLPLGSRPSLCDCPHCKSIFGPAAYLFELLSIFRRYNDSSFRSLLFRLEERRPDISRTQLSCSNTNIEVPQIDLVNEILEDLILAPRGTSVAHGLGPGECLPPTRQSRGTSEERRAIPQNEPSEELLRLLGEATFPWTLPYDYHRDRARSTLDQLTTHPEEFALAVWKFANASETTSLNDATHALATWMLDLSELQSRLITSTSPLLRIWGSEVADALNRGGPELGLLVRVAATDYETLETVLDTDFVRGDAAHDALRLEPTSFCETGEPPRLVGAAATLSAVLDRFHRFERLRRHLGWSVTDLDRALQWLGGRLEASQLEQIGLLRFLERRLNVTPTELVTLFSDPSSVPPTTMRPRAVDSEFDLQFGRGSSILVWPGTRLEESERIDSVRTQIAKASGESVATVDLAFSWGVVAPLNDVDEILALTPADAQHAYRRAVASTYRLSLWARQLRLEVTEFLDIVALDELQILSLDATTVNRLRDAIQLVVLAEEKAAWPVSVSELRYLVGRDAASAEMHAPSVSDVGASLMALRAELFASQEATKPLPEDARAALRMALSRLLLSAMPDDEAAADDLAEDLSLAMEWSLFIPSRANDVDAFLSQILTNWPGVPTAGTPFTEELDGAIHSLSDTLRDCLSESFEAPYTWPSDELTTLDHDLQVVVTRTLEDPSFDALATFQTAFTTFHRAVGPTTPADAPPDLPRKILASAAERLEVRLGAHLRERAALLLPMVEDAARQMQARTVLAEWVARQYDVTLAAARALLEQLSDPAGSQSIEGAFIDEKGYVSQRLEASVVRASYFESSGSGPALLNRRENTLVFDWSSEPPLPRFKDQAFRVELEVDVPSFHFVTADGSSLTLAAEANGEVHVEIEDDDGLHSIISHGPTTEDDLGHVQRHEGSVSGLSGRNVTLHVRHTTPPGGVRILRILKKSPDGAIEDFQWASLATAALRLSRGALALRNLRIPPEVIRVLRDGGHSRIVNLDQLAADSPLTDWLALFSLNELSQRIQTLRARPAFVSLLGGGQVSRSDLGEVLDLDDHELEPALQVMGVSDPVADAVTLPPELDLRQIQAAINLVDLGRRFNLPAHVLGRWYQGSPLQRYEWCLAALRVGLEPSEWLQVLSEVHDPVREHLRDAQLDYLVGRDQDRTGEPQLFSSRESISDYLLADTQMSACMATSRIQFAYSSVQRYVDAGQAGRAPWLASGRQEERFGREWVYMRFYRLYEAQMRVEVHTENWVDPSLRPTKTPAFKRFEERLQSGPLTLQIAEEALSEYAESLADVAHLEPVAIVTHDSEQRDRQPAFRDVELPGTHVFARTRDYPKRLYYRRRLPLPDGRWTPWERIDSELEGTHYLAVIVFGRLRFICADFSVARKTRPDQCAAVNGANRSRSAAGEPTFTDYDVSLSWIDREHGQWSRVHRSGRFPFSIEVAYPPARSFIFETGLPRDRFPEFNDQTPVDSVAVAVTFGHDGMNDGSKMKVVLRDRDADDGDDLVVGEIGQRNGIPGRETIEIRSEISSANALASLERVRLEWLESGQDDWDVTWVVAKFLGEEGEPVHVSSALHGKKREFGGDDQDYHHGPGWSSQSLPVRLQGGFRDGDVEREDSCHVFEGELYRPFRENVIQATEDRFHIDYEIIPDSIDVTDAVALQAAAIQPDAFEIRLYSVPHTQRAKARARFKPTDATLRIPGASKAWGEDWVASELCFQFSTDHQPLTTLKVFADDTIQTQPGANVPLGSHAGTAARGQELVSSRRTEFVESGRIPLPGLPGSVPVMTPVESTERRIFCDERPVATALSSYQLTVERHSTLSSMLSPKILDEMHGRREPARTFFIERLRGVEAPAEADTPDLDSSPAVHLHLTPPDDPSDLFSGDQSNTSSISTQPSVAPPSRSQNGKTIALGTESLFRAIQGLNNGHPNDSVRRRELRRFLAEVRPVGLRTLGPTNEVWRFHTFWHPQAEGFRRVLESRGLAQLMRFENQSLGPGTDMPQQAGRVDYFASFAPTRYVDPRWPRDVVDFTVAGPFSEYNWELLFDSLVLLTERFDEIHKFDEADEIFALLLDTTRVGQPGAWDDPTLYQTAPVRQSVALESEGPTGLIDGGHIHEEIVAQLERIRLNPYQPHIIARGWPTVYARMLRIRYVEHLISAGEFHFRRAYMSDNRTDLEVASAHFELAARCLGPTEGHLAAAADEEVPCYATLMERGIDVPAQGVEILEPYLSARSLGGSCAASTSGTARLHFCVPTNDKLDELRAQVAELSLKLHSCQDIDGVRRALSLYGQRIDPALLVRATAEGLDLDVLMGRISGAKPSMYFQALWQRARQSAEWERSLEEMMVSAQDRAESEHMLRFEQEQGIRALEGQLEVTKQRLQDARQFKEAIDRTIESAEIRYDYYSTREKINAQEKAEGDKLMESARADARAASDSRSASDWAWVPTAEVYADAGAGYPPPGGYLRAGLNTRYRLGGETGVQVHRANAEGHRHDAAETRVEAGLLGRQAGFTRRDEDCKLNATIAQKDIQKAETDRAGAEIRIAIAELEVDLHKQRIEDAKAVHTLLRDKVLSEELRSWQANRARRLLYQQHRIAFDLVCQSRAALVREHGLEEQEFVTDPWDNSRMGIGAAAALISELEKQQRVYMETWRREQEKLKAYSLAERDPLAFLQLIQQGEAIFSVTEADYDEDGAGDYFRRIRHVSLDVPAVRGPYTNVNARLTQLRGEVRKAPFRSTDGSYEREGREDMRFVDDLATGDFIVTNTGVQDDGSLAQQRDSEHPRPFAMNGAIGTFRVELSPDLNHFDRTTVTDVIARFMITSRPGGEVATQAGVSARSRRLAEEAQPVMVPLHSTFSDAWYRFVEGLNRGDASQLELNFEKSLIPLRLQPVSRIVQSNLYFAIPEGQAIRPDDGEDDGRERSSETEGEFSMPPELQPARRSIGDPHIPPPVHRLKLEHPLQLGQERLLRFSSTSGTATPERAWLICWVLGTRPEQT